MVRIQFAAYWTPGGPRIDSIPFQMGPNRLFRRNRPASGRFHPEGAIFKSRKGRFSRPWAPLRGPLGPLLGPIWAILRPGCRLVTLDGRPNDALWSHTPFGTVWSRQGEVSGPQDAFLGHFWLILAPPKGPPFCPLQSVA